MHRALDWPRYFGNGTLVIDSSGPGFPDPEGRQGFVLEHSLGRDAPCVDALRQLVVYELVVESGGRRVRPGRGEVDALGPALIIIEWLLGIVDRRSEAGVVQIVLGGITFFTALIARHYALKLGVRHQ